MSSPRTRLAALVPVPRPVPGIELVLCPAASPAEARRAVADGADGVLASARAGSVAAEFAAALPDSALLILDGPAELSDVVGVAGVLSDRGAVRLVTSVPDARHALDTGARLVIYDVAAMQAELLASLVGALAAPDSTTAREPLVLLSGMLGDATVWEPIAERLADRALPWPVRIDLDDSVPELASSVLAQAPDRFALCGHSLGAIVALEMIRQQPRRITRLALVNASGRGPSEAQQAAWAKLRRRTETGDFAAVAGELARATLGRAEPELVTTNERMARSVGPAGLLRQLAAQASRPASLPHLDRIDVPVLVLSGDLDEVCPPALQVELAEHIPGARLVTVAGGGHMLPLEQPDELASALREWLRGQ